LLTVFSSNYLCKFRAKEALNEIYPLASVIEVLNTLGGAENTVAEFWDKLAC